MANEQPSPPPAGNKKRSELQTLIALLNTMYEVSNMPMRNLMSTMRGNVDVGSGIIIFHDLSRKSQITAKDLRNRGNELFAEGHLEKAVITFTRCLSFTTEGSEEAASAYANRSAVFFKFNMYKECIEDVDRALSGPYPDEKRQSLLDRKEVCTTLLEEQERHPESVRRTETKASEEKEWRDMCKFTNPLIPNASVKIKLGYDETYGRHWLAAENIRTGQILCYEPFFTMIKLPTVQYEYCSHCLTVCLALIPCLSCTQNVYCSTFCRSEANAMYHRIECKFLALKEMRPHYQLNGDLMVLRTLLIGTKQGAGLKTLMAELPMEDILMDNYDPTGKPFASDYWHVLKLRRVFPKPLINYTMKLEVIVATIIGLRQVGFFHSDSDQENAEQEGANDGNKGMSKEELFTALLLYNHVLSIKLSVKAMRATIEKGPSAYHEVLIGMGLCTLCNMLNHSCNPQVRSFVRGGKLAVMACRPIQKGEQIFEGYANGYWMDSLAERVKQLSASHSGYDRFTCRCEACLNAWPTYAELHLRELQLLGNSVPQVQEEFQGIVVSFVNGRLHDFSKQEIFLFFCMICTWMHKRIQKPAYTIVDCEELLFGYMTYFYGIGCIRERTVLGWKHSTNVNQVLNNILSSRLFSNGTDEEFII